MTNLFVHQLFFLNWKRTQIEMCPKDGNLFRNDGSYPPALLSPSPRVLCICSHAVFCILQFLAIYFWGVGRCYCLQFECINAFFWQTKSHVSSLDSCLSIYTKDESYRPWASFLNDLRMDLQVFVSQNWFTKGLRVLSEFLKESCQWFCKCLQVKTCQALDPSQVFTHKCRSCEWSQVNV